MTISVNNVAASGCCADKGCLPSFVEVISTDGGCGVLEVPVTKFELVVGKDVWDDNGFENMVKVGNTDGVIDIIEECPLYGVALSTNDS